MQKFIVIGHPLSGYQAIENLLCQHGMAQALPTQRDSFSPQAISTLLCKAHALQPLHVPDTGEVSHLPAQMSQIDVAPAWNGLVMDLLLSNIEQTTFWGWSDPQAIHLLDYWKQQDQTLKFIFVYNSPETAFAPAIGQNNVDTLQPGGDAGAAADLDEQARQWHAFNAAMLHFYNRNTDRCVLLHAGQAGVAQSLQDVDQLGRLLKAPLYALSAAEKIVADQATQAQEALLLPEKRELLIESTSLPHEHLLTRFLATQVSQQYPFLQELYEELQAVANWPLGLSDSKDIALDVKTAWQASLGNLQQYAQERAFAQEEKKLLLAQLDQMQQELDLSILQLKKNENALTSAKERELQVENGMLLAQLHKVQEELEQYYLQLKTMKNAAGSAALGPAIVQKGQAGSAIRKTAKVSAKNAAKPASEQQIIAKAIRQLKARMQARTIAQSGEFDGNWYLAQNPDVARLRVFAKNPALHYLLHGVEESRSPSLHFSTWDYLRKYPDVRASGMNPFLHYVCHGKAEGRR